MDSLISIPGSPMRNKPNNNRLRFFAAFSSASVGFCSITVLSNIRCLSKPIPTLESDRAYLPPLDKCWESFGFYSGQAFGKHLAGQTKQIPHSIPQKSYMAAGARVCILRAIKRFLINLNDCSGEIYETQ
ncbi:hypothetical protein NP590_19410 [Methylomonas sp. SURF-2]|uniref:Uncharacterized protein n=1 Tax=Methylomonas subterranea TaxID=2952225 RepID=A0ABT1TLD1_9GAMM|nr:hypothetical protein [Methylomonas sp. SURF-2]MCQ8106282.1 hypothetical protein [Methylomonas sp. SURF-2]